MRNLAHLEKVYCRQILMMAGNPQERYRTSRTLSFIAPANAPGTSSVFSSDPPAPQAEVGSKSEFLSFLVSFGFFSDFQFFVMRIF